MRKTLLFLAVSLCASLVSVAPVSGQPESRREARGGFSMTVHTHSTPGTLFPTKRLEIPYEEGDTFAYSSIPCNRRAPFNDVALNFNPDYPGLQDPAPVRHLFEGTVTRTNPSGTRGTIEGTLTTILCENGQETNDTITFAYRGRFVRVSDDELRVTGSYEIIGGTGRFEDLEGRGSITGSLTCLGPATCADLGYFGDAVFRLRGNYSDPTVPA